jgi:hypothetical protein
MRGRKIERPHGSTLPGDLNTEASGYSDPQDQVK